MKATATKLTNGARRTAILQCLVALKDFMSRFQDVFWWLEGETLMGAVRKGAFLPWDVDADVTVTAKTWKTVQKYLKGLKHSGDDILPKPASKTCGCLIVDTASFGSNRISSSAEWNGMPGRVIHECTGNYVNIYTAYSSTYASLELSRAPKPSGRPFKWSKTVIFPLKRCSLSGIALECPQKAVSYLEKEYSSPLKAGYKWDAKSCAFVKSRAKAGQPAGLGAKLYGKCAGKSRVPRAKHHGSNLVGAFHSNLDSGIKSVQNRIQDIIKGVTHRIKKALHGKGHKAPSKGHLVNLKSPADTRKKIFAMEAGLLDRGHKKQVTIFGGKV